MELTITGPNANYGVVDASGDLGVADTDERILVFDPTDGDKLYYNGSQFAIVDLSLNLQTTDFIIEPIL
ncbi:MAG: hypothetical protein AB4042_13730 [Leptolyngbyaceae cyanobacterium]